VKRKWIPPQKRRSWRYVHRLLMWDWRISYAISRIFGRPGMWVWYRTLGRLWPFGWARRQHSTAWIWCAMQPSPMMVHLRLAGTLSQEQGDTDG